MAKVIYNHKNRITGSQPAILKAVYPGMVVRFKYRKQKVFDDTPLLLVLHKDYVEKLVHGLNLNYLSSREMKSITSNIIEGAAISGKNILTTEDQTEDYDDSLPYRNLLKKPYTRLKLPVFKEKRDGKILSQSKAKRQMDMLYEKVIKRIMNQKKLNIYRTYHINLMSQMRVLEFDFAK